MSWARTLPRVAWGFGVVATFTVVATRFAEPPSGRDAAAVAGASVAAESVASSGPAERPPASTAAAVAASIGSPASDTSPPTAAPVEASAPGTADLSHRTLPALGDPGAPWVADQALRPAERERITPANLVSNPALVGQPWGTTVPGVLTFRGNPTRTYHGEGPVPAAPQVTWRYPDRAMCGLSSEYDTTKSWCGTGWTGQPAVFERDGRTWLVFGAYDYKIHFVDAATGADLIPPFPTGDIAKGAVTVDPDGYPLIYVGSRDNRYRVIAFDRPEPVELWSLDANSVGPRLWNNDWDAAGLVHNDWLIQGGENSRLHLIKLNRGYGADGLVTAAPVLAWHGAGWDDELLANLPDVRVSLEASVMILGDTAYFASSGGLVQGWDVSVMRTGVGEPYRTFRFWTGDDTDATIIGDADGYLYVGVEVDRNTARARGLGQLLKLDPRRPDDPVVWAVNVNTGVDSGTWSTAALVGDTVIWPTKPGRVYGIDRRNGAIRWEFRVTAPVLASPVVVDDTLLIGDGSGTLRAYALGDGATQPVEAWSVRLGANIESTPVVWKGRVYVGDRSGYVYALGD